MEIVNYKLINKGCLVAKFDVRIEEWGLTIRNCSLFSKADKEWISLPSQQYQGADGIKKNFDLVVFDKDKKERFQNACLSKIKANLVTKKPEHKTNGNNDLPF